MSNIVDIICLLKQGRSFKISASIKNVTVKISTLDVHNLFSVNTER